MIVNILIRHQGRFVSALGTKALTIQDGCVERTSCPSPTMASTMADSKSKSQHSITTSRWLFNSLWKEDATRLSALMFWASSRRGDSWSEVSSQNSFTKLCFCHKFVPLPVGIVLIRNICIGIIHIFMSFIRYALGVWRPSMRASVLTSRWQDNQSV